MMQLATVVSYKLQETLWSGVVVSSFISKVEFTHFIDTSVDI